MRYVTVNVDVDVDLNDLDIQDMIEYLEDIGYKVVEEDDLSEIDIFNRLRSIGDKRRLDQPWLDDFDTLLKDVLGRAF